MLGAVSVATACVLPGSVAQGIAKIPSGKPIIMSVEHPSGEFTVQLEVEGDGANFSVGRSGILRTARALFEGHLLVPAGGLGRQVSDLSDLEVLGIERACTLLVVDFAYALDRKQYAKLAELFDENSTYTRPIEPDIVIRGRDNIRRLFDSRPAGSHHGAPARQHPDRGALGGKGARIEPRRADRTAP